MSVFTKLTLRALGVATISSLVLMAGGVATAQSPEQTPVGAIHAGSSDGVIPAYNGGIWEVPLGYARGDAYISPFSDDRPIFTITSSNASQYSSHLTPGLAALLNRYPTSFSVPVYPTRRSASFPQWYMDASESSTPSASMSGTDQNAVIQFSGGEGVIGIPFPNPTSGLEAISNHRMRYRGGSATATIQQVAPQASGDYTMMETDLAYTSFIADTPVLLEGNIIRKYKERVRTPARIAGTSILVYDMVDHVANSQMNWTYSAGQRRVRRSPELVYDAPLELADGLATYDMLDMFQGDTSRYEWTLEGRQEYILPYNAYDLINADYRNVVYRAHLNPEYTRFERHRVWVVKAELRDGMAHTYPSRTFYLDEDSWQILAAEHYDANGQLAVVSLAFPINFYDAPTFMSAVDVHHNLSSGRYFARGFLGRGERDASIDFDAVLEQHEFTPQALRREGRR
ncbi:DUF1329 domain-containing protein [Ponticaulis sp.]|uniref:DUF1329 domain-containing protein n=1 Tax=Ponticaulis sp. TaxID=2020902 RepID=UPI000B64E59C|nr:DUF1329 domain-containing protein [Ponticaulis sp.]MAJ07481.1 outer membrane lipoprotein-sorting protein [Ponticaulis sp.]RPG17713.1 MAG: DUF1329 domain-containing protein [Hyphomonadaceae bacterium TMED125]HBH91476.1 DUF1329 domain-containing protein [Hyphomonadaceae bacterium]|tara:strand:- start:26336 stop:27706 length:1371 start_codon:yes stop_codon:yes gene_type:complete